MVELEELNALPDAVFVVRHGSVAWVSDGASAMLKTPPDRLIGTALAELLAPGELERLRVLHEQRSQGWHIPAVTRVRFLRQHDGSEVAADVRFVVGAGDADLTICARDASELIRAEDLAAALTGVWGADVESLLEASSHIFRARHWTVAFTEIVDETSIVRTVLAEPDDPIGNYGRTLVGRVLSFERTPVVAEVVRKGRPLFLDNLPTLMKGSLAQAIQLGTSMTEARVARSAWCPVLRDDRVTHVLTAAGPDLSEYDFIALQIFTGRLSAVMRTEELREELVRSERLAALGEMAAVLAHEIRNPLAVIFNTVSAFRRQANGLQAPLLEILADEAGHLERLASDLLVWARPPTAAVQASELLPIVKEAVQAAHLGPDAASDVSIAVELPDDLPLARIDAPLLHRALVNLLTNALQHAPSGGKVRVSGAEEPTGGVTLRVENDGPAIPREDARRIFDPFFTKRPRGTGLGLCVVKQLVEGMGGSVELERPANPVSFAIRLPTEPR